MKAKHEIECLVSIARKKKKSNPGSSVFEILEYGSNFDFIREKTVVTQNSYSKPTCGNLGMDT